MSNLNIIDSYGNLHKYKDKISGSDIYRTGYVPARHVNGLLSWIADGRYPKYYPAYKFSREEISLILADVYESRDTAPYTTTHYWDCECKENYIHKSYFKECKLCGALRDESPDSHLIEVLQIRGRR